MSPTRSVRVVAVGHSRKITVGDQTIMLGGRQARELLRQLVDLEAAHRAGYRIQGGGS